MTKYIKESKTLFSLLVITFLVLSSCLSTNQTRMSNEWPTPNKPEIKPVKFHEVQGGFFIDYENSTNLMNNIDEIKMYNRKMEILIKEVFKYYE